MSELLFWPSETRKVNNVYYRTEPCWTTLAWQLFYKLQHNKDLGRCRTLEMAFSTWSSRTVPWPAFKNKTKIIESCCFFLLSLPRICLQITDKSLHNWHLQNRFKNTYKSYTIVRAGQFDRNDVMTLTFFSFSRSIHPSPWHIFHVS